MSSAPKYEVLCPLSPGDPSKSLLAVQRGIAGFRKLVVLRPVQPDLISSEAAGSRFLADVKTAVCLSHPYIAATYQVDVMDGRLYVSTEFVPGATLADIVDGCAAINARVPLGVVLRAIRDAAYALHYAHTFTDPLGRPRPLLHRALTDRSILVTFDGAIKVLDFASPRPAVHDPQLGSFAPAEQIRGDDVDARADVFSLGAVAHSCLTGTRYSYADVLSRSPTKAEFPPPSERHPDAPPQLDPVLMRALYPTRDSRYRTMLEFARELERVAGSLLARPEQCAASVGKLFPGIREQLRSVVTDNEEKLTTAVMPLSAILSSGEEDGDDHHSLPTGQFSAPELEASAHQPEPTAPEREAEELYEQDFQEASPAPEPRESAPTGKFTPAIDDLPPTGQLPRVAAEKDRPDEEDEEAEDEPRRGRPVLKLFVALTMLAVVAGVGAWVLNPAWVRAKIELARGRLGLAPPPEPVEFAAAEPDAGVEASAENTGAPADDGGALAQTEEAGDAGALAHAEGAPDAGVELAAGTTADAGTVSVAKASVTEKKKPDRRKKRRRR